MSVNNVIDETELPAWMKQARRGVDWGAILIVGFCLIAAWSFIAQEELSAANDTLAYVFRSMDYADAFEEGYLYNRWSPHAVNGYGAPIPHYYPSGAAYAGGLISYLFTNDAITAVRVLYVFSLIVAGSMTYTFVTQRTTALAGMVAALLYVFSPYVMVTVSYIEGDLPLAIGTALLPSLLWAVNRLLKRYQAMDFMLIALIVAFTVFTVPIMLLQGTIAILVLLIIEFRNKPDWTKLLTLAGAILTGVLISVFYWLPALRQYNDIVWHDSFFETAPYRITFESLFALPHPLDSALTIHQPNYAIGWGLLLALLINLPLIPVTKTDRWFSTAFFIAGLSILLLVILLIPDSTAWFTLIIFCFAISGSYIAQGITRSRIHSFFIVVILIFNLFIILPFQILPVPGFAINDVSAAAQVEYEQSGSGYAGLPYGSPLPSNLAPMDALELTISESYAEDVVRLRSPGIISPLVEESPYTGRYTVSSEEDISLDYDRAYFDGWQAVSSEGNLEISESQQHFLSVRIPAGMDGTVIFRPRLTAINLTAWIIALIALFCCLVFWWHRWQRSEFDYDDSILLTGRAVRLFTVLLFVTGVARFIVPFLPGNAIIPEAEYSLEFPVLSVRANYNRELQLLAYELPNRSYSGGDTVRLSSFWNILREVDVQYLVQLRITDNLQRTVIYESGYNHPGYFPTSRWETNSILPMVFDFKLPVDAPRGNHLIMFNIYPCTVPCTADMRLSSEAEGQIRISRPITVD